EEIATKFNCDQSTISKILKQKKWSKVQETLQISNALKIASPKFPQIGSAKQQNLIISGNIIRQKALQFAILLGISEEEFKASQEWLVQFKARIGLYNHQIHREAEMVEKDKTRITILFTANADSTEKLVPLVINISKMPNAFRNTNITHNQLPVDYYHNEIDFNEYPNIHIHILPPHTTSHLQPIDVRVINTFKAYYKRLYIRKVICDFDIDTISTETIKNCWYHTGILPSRHLDKIFLELEMMIENETQNIQVSEVIVAQHKAQDIIDLTVNTNI
ncbi:36873_t:CDS:2, partial [Gigaspora margarita]